MLIFAQFWRQKIARDSCRERRAGSKLVIVDTLARVAEGSSEGLSEGDNGGEEGRIRSNSEEARGIRSRHIDVAVDVDKEASQPASWPLVDMESVYMWKLHELWIVVLLREMDKGWGCVWLSRTSLGLECLWVSLA